MATTSGQGVGFRPKVVGEEAGDRDAFFAECVRRWIQFMDLR